MPRQIKDLTEGTIVYLDETISGTTAHVPYIYLGLDEGGNARLLRKYAAVQKRMHSSNVASYSGCEADVWLENAVDGFLSRFDAATINALANTSISYVDYTLNEEQTPQLATISRRCFILSYTEDGWSATVTGSEGKSYLAALKAAYLADHPEASSVSDNNARIGYNENDIAVGVWVRSASSPDSFRGVSTSGGAYSYLAANAGFCLRPALAVAPATSVSPEGADEIFLLPDGRRTTWDIAAIMSLGQTVARPKKAKLILEKNAISSISVWACNNYADASPTWCAIGQDGTVTLGESKTADNWELGVKIEAAGSSHLSYVGEPALIVEYDEE